MGKRILIYIIILFAVSCNFLRDNSGKCECIQLKDDLSLCIKRIDDSIETVFTTVAGIQDGLAIERMYADKRILTLKTMKDWKEIGLQYEFHSNGSVKQVKEMFKGRQVNWRMEFNKIGEITIAEYTHDKIKTTDLGAILKYTNGFIDLDRSMGVIGIGLNNDISFKVLHPEGADSIYFFLLDRKYDIKWRAKCTRNKVAIPREDFNSIDPVIILTQIFQTVDGTMYFEENYLKYNEMLPPLNKAPKIVVPKYLVEAE